MSLRGAGRTDRRSEVDVRHESQTQSRRVWPEQGKLERQVPKARAGAGVAAGCGAPAGLRHLQGWAPPSGCLGASTATLPAPPSTAPPSSSAHLSLLVMGPCPAQPPTMCRGSPGMPRCIEPPGQRLRNFPDPLPLVGLQIPRLARKATFVCVPNTSFS